MNTDSHTGREICRTIVYLDLSRYSAITGSLEIQHGLGPYATVKVKEQIKELIGEALTQSNNEWGECFVEGTGDGAILCFSSVTEANQFAEALHIRADKQYNQRANYELEHRCFRVGIFTGNVIRDSDVVSGIAVVFAARLEKEAVTGEILMAAESWAALPPDL